MQGIFINYRREDSEGYAITLQDYLAKHFGKKQLFMDVDNIEPGIDFMTAIENSLSACQVVLVLIGTRWLNATDHLGNRRLDNPHDPLRIEIETALKSEARVIPVLLHGTLMPNADDLPETLAPLTRRHAIEISSSRRDYDLKRLVSTLEKIPGLEPLKKESLNTDNSTAAPQVEKHNISSTTPPPRSNAFKHGIFGAAATLLLLITLGLVYDEESTTPTSSTAELAVISPPPAEVSTPPATRPQVTQAPQATVLAQPAAQQPQVANINLSGTWYDDGGTRFEAEQKGKTFIATGYNLFGMATKQLHGTVTGNTLNFTLQDGFVETNGTATLNADGQHLDYTLKDGNFSETGQLHLNHTRN